MAVEIDDTNNARGFLEWLVKINNIEELWERQPTYLLVQACFLFGALMTFIHAYSSKGRWPLLWCCTVCHGLVIEALCFFLPEDVADNYWHSQTPVVFLGGRLPLHIIVLYPCFYYQATAAVNKFQFSIWTEPFAVALLVLLQDVPYDIIGVKFVHWTWHDTDPNLFDRHYWVPWNSYFFHAAFSASFTFWFHFIRSGTSGTKKDWRKRKWQIQSTSSEALAFVLTSVLGCVGGTIVFMLIYHPLHDMLGIHSEITFFIVFAMFCLIVWKAISFSGATDKHCVFNDYLLLCHLVVHYSIFLILALFGSPENEISIGYHEQIGPCNQTVQFPSAVGKLLSKRKYLCLEDYDEQYFDFQCCSSLPIQYSKWYQICGTPFPNRAEYVTIVALPTIMAAFVFGNIYANYGRTKNTKQS
ncbi:hypothetical protein M8J75_007463 [Diaphorina citri]|nr:hypothetical protein M8J75_007463 [Diaphorina citri]